MPCCPSGRSLQQVNPNGTLVMGVTAFTGDQAAWQPVQTTLTNASAAFVQAELQRLAVLALQASFAQLPTGKIALLPLNTAGAGANFAAATGLNQKWDALTELQFVDTNQFNAARYPLAFYLGSENYVKTVVTNGDGKAAITQYLAGGGTLVILATGPFPFYYGYGPADQPGPVGPVVARLGAADTGQFRAGARRHRHAALHQPIHPPLRADGLSIPSRRSAAARRQPHLSQLGQSLPAVDQGSGSSRHRLRRRRRVHRVRHRGGDRRQGALHLVHAPYRDRKASPS